MAIYHLSMKILSRSDGKSAVAAAAYRAGEKLKDERSGTMHDYTKKRNVITSALILPDGVTCEMARQELWNRAEAAERRKNSCVAREIEVALPAKLPQEAQIRLATQYAQDIADRYGLAADVAVHAAAHGGDERNVHAHILLTTRRISQTGQLTDKARELDDYKTRTAELDYIRTHWANMCNLELEHYGIAERVDHRSLSAQGIDRAPQIHVGVHATQMERRGIETERGEQNRQRQRINNGIERIERTISRGEAEKKQAAIPTQKPVEAAKSPETEIYTQEQIMGARRALNDAQRRHEALLRDALAKWTEQQLAPLRRQEAQQNKAIADWKDAEPKKKLLESRKAYESRWQAWSEQLKTLLAGLTQISEKIKSKQQEHGKISLRIQGEAEKRARKDLPQAARMVDWEKEQKELRLQERLQQRQREREQEKELGGWER